jgi:Leucine-rich repeat (LRR) protein
MKVLNLKTWDRFKTKFYMKKIINIENLAFFDLNSIEKLDLSYNDIEIIKANTFKGLIKLKHLNLSFNKINKIDKSAFKELICLEKFDLSFNNLKFIPKNSFSSLVNLKELNLIGNVGLMGAAKMFKSKEDFDKIFQSNKVINILNTLYNSIF